MVTVFKMGDTSSTLTEIPDLQDFPDLMGMPDRIDVTTMKDTERKYEPGLKDPGDMVFNFLHRTSATGSPYNKFRLAEASGSIKYFSILFPDGSGFTWSGKLTVSFIGKGIGEARQFSVNITPTSDIEDIIPAT